MTEDMTPAISRFSEPFSMSRFGYDIEIPAEALSQHLVPSGSKGEQIIFPQKTPRDKNRRGTRY
jgi:hypothetical protein